jgi:hypothetical protein
MGATAVAADVSDSTTEVYRPGACNIGVHERRRRYRLAAGALLAAVGYLAVVVVTGLPAVFALGAFVPLSLGCEWCLQGRRSFCATLGFAGRSFCATLGFAGRYAFPGARGRVPDGGARQADRRYAFRLTILGLLAGAVLTLGTYVALLLA